MEIIELSVSNAQIRHSGSLPTFTAGMQGSIACRFTFSEAWNGLSKTAVFRAGRQGQALSEAQENWQSADSVLLPQELFEQAGFFVEVGVYGSDGSGIVIPTIWYTLGKILPGAPAVTEITMRAKLDEALGRLKTMTGASREHAGTEGLVPAPAAGCQNKLLFGNAQWRTPHADDIYAQVRVDGQDAETVQDALVLLADSSEKLVPMVGASANSDGAAGLVPKPLSTDRNKVLHGNGYWSRIDAEDIDLQTQSLYSDNVQDALNELADSTDELAGSVDELSDAVLALKNREPNADGIVRSACVHSINHRGYNTEAPENTLPAFLLSKARGFAMVETDVCFTSDGVAVLLHDNSINRTARNADGTELSATVNISDITYAQALEYDFGIWKDAKYAGTRIPTLEEFLQLCKDNALHPYIEIKNSGVVNGQVTAEMTALLRDSAVAVAKDMDMLGRITWISFSAPILAKLAELDAVSRLGYIVSQGNNGGITDTVIQEVRAIDPTLKRVFIDSSSYTAAEISRCKAAEIPLEIWTLDDWTGVSLDPYITGVTSNYRIAGEVLQNNDSRARDASHVVIPWTRANGLSSSNGSDSSTGDYRMLLMDFLPVRKNEVYQFHSRVSESDFLSTSDHKMVTVVAYYDEKQRFLRGTYSSLSNPNVVNGYCVRKDAISITGTNADARYIRISFRSMNTASYGLLRVRDANGELTPSLERLLFERLESTDAQAATLAAQLTPMTGATAQAAGTAGLVPAPASGDNGRFLRGDATWQRVNADDVNFSSVYFDADNVEDALNELYGAFQDTITAVNTALASVVGGGSNG